MPLILTERNRQQALKDQKDLISTTKELFKLKEEHRIIDAERLENWKMMIEWRKMMIECDDERYDAMTLSPRSDRSARSARSPKKARKARRKSRKAKKAKKAKRKTRRKSKKARRSKKK